MNISESEFKELPAYELFINECAKYYIDLNEWEFHSVVMEPTSDDNTGAYIAVNGLAQYVIQDTKQTLAYDFHRLPFTDDWKLNDFRLINEGCHEGLF